MPGRVVVVAVVALFLGSACFGSEDPPTATPEAVVCTFEDAVELVTNASALVITGSGFGTAFHIGGGQFVTAAHVVTGEREVLLKSHLINTRARVVMIDGSADSALLEADMTRNPSFAALDWRNDTEVRKGETVGTIGYPASVDEGEGSVSRGTFSRFVENSGIGLIQTDTPVNSGNSGGALFDTCGNAIGLISFKLSDEAIEGIAYAVSGGSARYALDLPEPTAGASTVTSLQPSAEPTQIPTSPTSTVAPTVEASATEVATPTPTPTATPIEILPVRQSSYSTRVTPYLGRIVGTEGVTAYRDCDSTDEPAGWEVPGGLLTLVTARGRDSCAGWLLIETPTPAMGVAAWVSASDLQTPVFLPDTTSMYSLIRMRAAFVLNANGSGFLDEEGVARWPLYTRCERGDAHAEVAGIRDREILIVVAEGKGECTGWTLAMIGTSGAFWIPRGNVDIRKTR